MLKNRISGKLAVSHRSRRVGAAYLPIADADLFHDLASADGRPVAEIVRESVLAWMAMRINKAMRDPVFVRED